MKLPPKKYLIQIGDDYLAAFIRYWISYEKPCNLLWRKPVHDGLTAIRVIIETDEAASFLYRAKNMIGFKISEEEIK